MRGEDQNSMPSEGAVLQPQLVFADSVSILKRDLLNEPPMDDYGRGGQDSKSMSKLQNYNSMAILNKMIQSTQESQIREDNSSSQNLCNSFPEISKLC